MSRFSLQRNDTAADQLERPAGPVLLDNHKTRPESLIEAAMQAAMHGRRHHYDDQELQLSSDSQLETRPSEDGKAPNDVFLEAYSEVALGVATPTSHLLAVEHYEALKANLWARYSGTAMKVVLFVGATARSGASTAAANCAALLAQEPGSKVLLIDANLRSPVRHDSTDADSAAGTSLSLARMLAAPSLTVYPGPGPSNLYVLPSGTKCPMPLSLFQSKAFDEFLRTARERFRYVVIDAPPLQGYPETLVLSRKVDGVILVIESEKTRKRSARWTKEQIEGAGGKLLGVVLNKRKYHIPDWLYKRI